MRTWAALLALLWIATPAVAFDSGDIGPGASWSMTFDAVNVDGHAYHCHPHPFMTGTVHVMEDSDGTVTTHEVDIVDSGDTSEWGFSKEHLNVEVGDTVTWTNAGTQVHTVTEGAEADHDDHDDEHDDAGSEGAPGLPLLGVVLAILVAVRRR